MRLLTKHARSRFCCAATPTQLSAPKHSLALEHRSLLWRAPLSTTLRKHRAWSPLHWEAEVVIVPPPEVVALGSDADVLDMHGVGRQKKAALVGLEFQTVGKLAAAVGGNGRLTNAVDAMDFSTSLCRRARSLAWRSKQRRA